MPQKHTWGTTFKSGADSVSVPTEIVEASGEAALDEDVAANATNVQHTLAIDVSALKSLMMIATTAMTLKTNNSVTPADTISLLANQVFRWTTNSGTPNPFASGTDVTSVFVTNGAAAGALRIFALYDATP